MSQEMVRSAHYAGMAEIATGVLHDVGNILNSVNVSCDVIRDITRSSKVDSLQRVNQLLLSHAEEDLAGFLTEHPKGRLLPRLYGELGNSLSEERRQLAQELSNLTQSINLIRDVIRTQQERAEVSALREETELVPVIEDALKLQNANIANHSVQIVRDFDENAPAIPIEKTKLIYVLVNLIKNGVEAMLGLDVPERVLRIRLRQENEEQVIGVADNGVGIEVEDESKIFAHGFTTKDNGHGFGLHASANYIAELGGSIEFQSEGRGRGVEFVLRLPVNPEEGREDTSSTGTKTLRRR